VAAIPVLLVVRELDLGGSERQLAEIAKALDRRKFTPHVGCFRPNGVRADELRSVGVPILHLKVHSFRHPSVIAAARDLGRYIRQHGIRLVHSFDVPANLFTVPAARALTDAVVLSSQRAHRALTPGIRRRLLQITDRMVDGIVVNCQAIVRDLVEGEGVPRNRIHLCYNGIDLQEFYPPTERVNNHPPPGSIVIGVVCALRPEKGLETLVDAFARVRSRKPGVKLTIVGSGPCLPELSGRAERLGISADCIFEPTTRDVANRLRGMDIFVLPSRSEALSNSLMEAMACRCAVVASSVGGNVELVEHGRTGLLFESGNVEELAVALEALVADEQRRLELGASAAQLLKDRFSLAISAERMGQIYSTFLGRTTD
jgi:glycosyltransferase involved in cell wall biosynthesis